MKLEKIFNFLFVLMVPSIIISFAANTVVLIALSIIAIYQSRASYTKSFLKKYGIFLSFFASIIISLFIDFLLQNEFDMSQIIKRAAFLLMPFIVFYAKKPIQILSLKVFVIFLSGLSFILILIGSIRSVLNKNDVLYGNWDSKTTEAFYNQNMIINWGELTYKRIFFILDMHPSYYALFSCIAIIILLFTKYINLTKTWKWVLITLNMLMIILVSSKAGLISLFLILIISFFSSKGFKPKIIGTMVMASIIILILSIPSTQLRIKKTFDSLTSDQIALDSKNVDDRLILWKSLKYFNTKELLLGNGYVTASDKIHEQTGINKNIHNQFLQSIVRSGLVGLLLLMFFLITPLLYRHSLFIKVFISLIVLNLLFENMLDRIWGIIFISFFYALFIFGKLKFSIQKYEDNNN